ncbi:MAG: hypothetical protein AB7E49_04075 [Campylobacterales bacterium]
MKKLLLSLLLATLGLAAQPGNFVLHNEEVILAKTAGKINEMCGELHAKTQIAVYLSAIAKLPENETITQYQERIAATLSAPYVLVSISRLDRQIELTTSSDLAGRIDKNEVLDDYIIPLLVEMRKDLSPQQQMSAGLLNGVAFVTDTLAEQEGIILTSSIGNESKDFYEGLMWVIKAMILLTIIGFFIAWRRSKQGA